MANRYTYSVPFTAEQLHHDYAVLGMTQEEVGKKWGVSQKVVWRALRKCDIAARRAVPRDQRMERNNGWKGGRHLLAQTPRQSAYADRGYVAVYRPDHAHARANGYVAEHIMVALADAGLDHLPEGTCVHHINLQKDDNASDNLVICDHVTHQRYHTQLEELAVRLLLEAGKIKFKRGFGYVEA